MTPTEMEDVVAPFLAIVNRSQTCQLREWNSESLRRALRWAALVEAAAVRSEEQQAQRQREAEDRFRERFPLAALPTLAPGALVRISDLRRAPQHLLGAVLQSPFLASHPIRSEIIALVLSEARVQRRSDPDSPLINLAAISRFLVKTAVDTQRSRASESIALAVSSSFKAMRVQVLSGQVVIPPIESYSLHPRTAKLLEVAGTLQLNAVNARAAPSTQQYASLLASVRDQLACDTSSDVAEVLALLVTSCKWPPPASDTPLRVEDPARDVQQVLVDWVSGKSSRCMLLPPWLAAKLAAVSDAFAAVYVSHLLHSGFLEPDHAFAHRAAALVVQNERLAVAVNTGLAQMDPLVLSKLLPSAVHGA